MGLDISVIRLIDIENHDWEELPHYMDGRFVGDRDLATAVPDCWDYEMCRKPYCCDYGFKRPKDFKKVREWVSKNIPQENQPRIVETLDLLEKDKDLYLYFCW